MRISGISGLLLYLGIGALSHLLFIGPTFDWDSAWTWAVLFGWPLLAGLAFFAAIGAVWLIVTVLLFLLNALDRPGRRNRHWEGW